MGYITIAEADILLAYRPEWATVADKQTAIELGSRYLDALYGSQYIGTIADATQDLLWPRTGITTDLMGREIVAGSIPGALQQATAEAAVLSGTGSNLLPNTVSSGGSTTSSTPSGVVTEETVKVGSLTTTKKYSAGGTQTETTNAVQLATEYGVPIISIVQSLMAPLIGTASTTTSSSVTYRLRA